MYKFTELEEKQQTLNPDAVLKQIRKEAERVLSSGPIIDFTEAAISLAKNFQDFDQWLSGEGYLPDAWSFPEPCELCGRKDCEVYCQED